MIREIPHRDGGGFFFPSNLDIGGFTPTHWCRKPSVADRTADSNNAKQAGIFSNSIPTVSHRQQKADLSSAKRSAMAAQKVTFRPLIRIILTNTFSRTRQPTLPHCLSKTVHHIERVADFIGRWMGKNRPHLIDIKATGRQAATVVTVLVSPLRWLLWPFPTVVGIVYLTTILRPLRM